MFPLVYSRSSRPRRFTMTHTHLPRSVYAVGGGACCRGVRLFPGVARWCVDVDFESPFIIRTMTAGLMGGEDVVLAAQLRGGCG